MMPDPELKGFDFIIDRINRIAMEKIVKRDLGASAPLHERRAASDFSRAIVNEWMSKGFSPSAIMRGIKSHLTRPGMPFGMAPEHPTDMPVGSGENADIPMPTLDETHLRQRMEAQTREGGRATFRT